MTANFLVIATMGSSGQKWLEEMLKKLPKVNLAHWITAMPPEYKKTIELNPMLRRVDMQNNTLRRLMPLDCLFEEVLRLYPPAPLNVVSHFHHAQSLWNNYQKYPNPMPHKVAYLFGCPIKRLRSAIKNNLHYTTQHAINEEALQLTVENTPQLQALVKNTEDHFSMTLTCEQRIFFALQMYRSLEICEDIRRAEILDARMINFEILKREPLLMQSLLAWASNDAYIPQESEINELYSGNENLAQYHYVGYKYADAAQEAIIAAPYEGKAIWESMSDWQRYFFQQTIKLSPIDYIDFYDELGIDISYMRYQ